MTELIHAKEGSWSCFHCGEIAPNTLLYCKKCGSVKKHSINMKKTQNKGDSSLNRKRGSDSERIRKTGSKYEKICIIVERAVVKLFFIGISSKTFTRKSTIYYRFDKNRYIYTIRRTRERTRKERDGVRRTRKE